jgi:nickel transport system ATP-binding protein
MNLLAVNNLSIADKKTKKVLVKDVSFELGKDTCTAIISESGSGKSLTCKAITGLNASNLVVRGSIIFKEKELTRLPAHEIISIRGKHIAMIMQNGMTAFNPSFTIGRFSHEVLREHFGYDLKKTRHVMAEALEKLSMDRGAIEKYPHQLTGGMLQRVMAAISLVLYPEIIILDEPTSSLDVIVQTDLIRELERVRKTQGASMISISHDLRVVQRIADSIIVMKDGLIIEQGLVKDIFLSPRHEYTQSLVTGRMRLNNKFRSVMEILQGENDELG